MVSSGFSSVVGCAREPALDLSVSTVSASFLWAGLRGVATPAGPFLFTASILAKYYRLSTSRANFLVKYLKASDREDGYNARYDGGGRPAKENPPARHAYPGGARQEIGRRRDYDK